jgi:hypothetical protein
MQMKKQNGFIRKQWKTPEENRARLIRYLKAKSGSVEARLKNWLGEDVKITSCADPETLTYTMEFSGRGLGTLGRICLKYGGDYVSPTGLDCSFYAGEMERSGERAAIMKEIDQKTRELFHRNTRWVIRFFRGDELLETRNVIDENIVRVKCIAYTTAPEGTDMIKLRKPNGKILIRTEKKHWTRG